MLTYVGAGLLAVAVIVLLALYFTAPKVVPLSRRRPADAAPAGVLPTVAAAASKAAGFALGGRAGALEDALESAGLRIRPQDFLVVVASGMVAGFAAGLLGGLGWALILMLLAPAVAVLVVRVMAGRRQRAFALQLDETLATLAGSLRAGFSLPQACVTVAKEAEEPTSTEFARVVNESRVGRPFVDALYDVAARTKNQDFEWIVQAIAINREVGGNLADTLSGVGTTIRERVQLKRQVEALAAEGKLSGIILGALPIVVFLLLWFANPAYMARFGESLLGIAALVVAGLLLVIGIFWLSKLIKIKY